jgi:hypothetical protein
MNITPEALDRAVLETLREAGSMTASEVSYEAGVDLDAAQRSLGRLAGGLLVRESFGSYSARREDSGARPKCSQ